MISICHRALYVINNNYIIGQLSILLINSESTSSYVDNFGISCCTVQRFRGWDLRVVFPDREALSRTYEAAQQAGLQFNVKTIYGSEDPRGVQYELTEKQRNMLATAFEARYFIVPRETSLADLAEQEDTSRHPRLSSVGGDRTAS